MKSLVLSMLNQVSNRFNEFRARSNKRGLIHQILSLQILITGAIGVVAIASLYWGGQWVLQDNYSRWALQWTEELNELGAPLYLQEDGEVVLRLESFVAKYPEIGRVTYYQDDGEVLNSIANESAADAAEDLSDSQVQEAQALVGAGEPYLIESSIMSPRQFEILAPVWTESIGGDGLFAFDMDQSGNGSSFELRGFVGLHLDFALFHDRLLENIKTAVLVLFFILVASALYGRHALRKALMSITDLQEPPA